MSRRVGLGLRWALVVAYSGVIFYLSSRSTLPAIGPEFPEKDKALHITAYAVWGLLFSIALRATWPGLREWPALLLTVLAGILYGASDEFHQSFVPNRTADLLDLVADGVGASLGALLHRLWHYRNAIRRSSPGR